MIVSLLVVGLDLARLWRETNSHAATARGVREFAAKQYAAAQKWFGTASGIAPTPRAAFNLGTAQIASGNRELGSATIAKALADPTLRADALFNRGNSALEAKAFDYAIRDYTDTLRIRPSDVAAKRNLEIALRRKDEQQHEQQHEQQGGNGQQKNEGKQPKPQPAPPQPQQGNPQQQNSDPNAEALLRSVQQQEQEELARMHRPSRERLHVGW